MNARFLRRPIIIAMLVMGVLIVLGGVCIGVSDGDSHRSRPAFRHLWLHSHQADGEYVDYVAAKLGDRIKIDQYVRFQAGEAMSDAAAGS